MYVARLWAAPDVVNRNFALLSLQFQVLLSIRRSFESGEDLRWY